MDLTAMSPVATLDSAYEYAARLLKHVAPECEVLPDLMGVLSQLDNWIAERVKELEHDKIGLEWEIRQMNLKNRFSEQSSESKPCPVCGKAKCTLNPSI